MNTAQLNFDVIDQTFSPNSIITGISGFMGVFEKGPIGKTDIIFSTWTQFKKIYGGLLSGNDDPLLVKRMLERGSKVRVCGIRHYTDITSGASLTAVKASNLATKVHTASIDFIAGTTATYTLDAVPVSQVFSVDSITTLKLLAAKILAAFPGKVDWVYVPTSRIIQITLVSGTGALTATGSGAPTIANTTLAGFKMGGTTLFTISPKYYGAKYNQLRVSVYPASNGNANYFNLKMEYADDPTYTPELYQNLTIPGSPTINNSHYLDDVIRGSEIVDVAYADLSGVAGPIIPGTNYSRYALGDDGGGVTDSDYIGDSSTKTGLHAFDAISDIYGIGSGNTSDNLAIAGAAYADARKDLQYFHHFPNSLVTAAQVAAAKDALNINTAYIEFWMGGLKVLDELTNLEKNIIAIGDILGAAAYSEFKFGPYRSFAGKTRGLITNARGVVNNFGADADLTNLNLLANHQINAVVNEDGQLALSGNFSGQLTTSHMSFNNVVRLIIYIQKTLKPLLKPFIEEPNDIPTWKSIYLTAKPFMDGLVTPKRALFDYQWQGDQFAASLDELQTNNANDVGLGKYLVNLFIKDITSLQEFNIAIILTKTDVSFETSATLL